MAIVNSHSAVATAATANRNTTTTTTTPTNNHTVGSCLTHSTLSPYLKLCRSLWILGTAHLLSGPVHQSTEL